MPSIKKKICGVKNAKILQSNWKTSSKVNMSCYNQYRYFLEQILQASPWFNHSYDDTNGYKEKNNYGYPYTRARLLHILCLLKGICSHHNIFDSNSNL